MIGALIGAAVNIGSGVVSGINKKKAAKAQKNLIAQEKQRATDLFNDQYYTDYNDTAEARSALNNVKSMYQDANKTTSLLGGNVSEEAKLARQASQDKAIAETSNNMAAIGTQRKDGIMSNYQSKLDNYASMDINRLDQEGKMWDGIAGAGQKLGTDIFKTSAFKKNEW